MENANSNSLFHHVRSRELSVFASRKRPYNFDTALDFSVSGTIAVEHNGEETLPLAMAFCKTNKSSYMLAVSDEDGYVSLFDTRMKFPSFSSYQDNTGKARVNEWVAHKNTIFDVCWIKDDTKIVTASGDQTIKAWDAQVGICTEVLIGHTGSVKSLSSHPANSHLIVSGSRDGSFAIWDLRCKTSRKSRWSDDCISSTAKVTGAHVSPKTKRIKRGKTASKSVTSVLYLKDEISIATAGAVNSMLKFWDTRNLKSEVTRACPHPEASADKEKVLHGISSLSQDSNGTFLTASCMDNRIYMYNVLQLENGPVQSFSACQIESFYIKAAISPDGAHILSGSSDGNAYIWQVNKPQLNPIILKGHSNGEVTSVDWCSSEVGKLATCADDFTVRIWDIEYNYCSDRSSSSSSSIRRRVMAVPNEECNKLLMKEEKSFGSNKDSNHHTPTSCSRGSTPESQKKKVWLDDGNSIENLDKTPQGMKSSYLLKTTPSFTKRTIRDYFQENSHVE